MKFGHVKNAPVAIACIAALAVAACVSLAGCGQQQEAQEEPVDTAAMVQDASDQAADAGDQDVASEEEPAEAPDPEPATEPEADAADEPEPDPEPEQPDASALRAALNITEDYRDSFIHGPKPAEYQRYIVLHDTEGEADGLSVVSYWDGNGAGVAAHFVVNMDGSIVQCVDLENITHHAGFGDTGHDDLFGVPEDGRDDRVGTVPICDWASDYGMNSYSVGIEMVHVGGSGYYPEEQLQAVDALIAYIDAYYGFESTIIDHKAWRTGNSDTSPEFADYLANYQDHRTHD